MTAMVAPPWPDEGLPCGGQSATVAVRRQRPNRHGSLPEGTGVVPHILPHGDGRPTQQLGRLRVDSRGHAQTGRQIDAAHDVDVTGRVAALAYSYPLDDPQKSPEV